MQSKKYLHNKEPNHFFKKNNIPNFLTFLRLLITLVIIILGTIIVLQRNSKISNNIDNSISKIFLSITILLILGYLTDFFDGYIARKWKCVTTIGKILDPIADKLLSFSVLIIMVSLGTISLLIPSLLLLRNWLVTGLRMNAANNNRIIAANIYGKITTVFIGIVLIIDCVVLIFLPEIKTLNLIHTKYYWIFNATFILPLLFSYISLFIYFKIFCFKKTN